ncbi:MAG: outer membrane lipoprotein carrier protein LolA [Odoribacteraceae bacterium]|jgi:outer membrane lipoprotein carrier protein|nr:outer membrane lipoprotein carrier protein LolA [Odoribacteraceae bacterium]
MKAKVLPLVALAFLLHASATAQSSRPATPEEQQFAREKIETAARAMSSMTCDFKQTKELSILDERIVSTGRMFYRRDNRLRWEYLSPYTYTFILNDKKILTRTENTRNVVDVKSSRLFQEIVRIMMSSVSGNGLTDEKRFAATFTRGKDATWSVTLVPLQREIKKMFSSIELTFNEKDFSVENVKMNEPNGDATLVELSGKLFNAAIEDEVFAID